MTHFRESAMIVALLAMTGTAAAAPPPFTISSLAKTGDPIAGLGTISTAYTLSVGRGPGFPSVAVNNSGQWLLGTHVYSTNVLVDNAILKSGMGLSPYIADNILGQLGVPGGTVVASGFASIGLSNSGNAGLALTMSTQPFDEFGEMHPSQTRGVYFNTSALPIYDPFVISAAGVAPGTVWSAWQPETTVRINDARQLLVASQIVESGTPKWAIVVLQLDVNGAVTSQTLIAKEGGPVGAGPATWVTLGRGGHAVAMNSAGRVAFSGTTSTGIDGVYVSGVGFTAVQGSASPQAGYSWASLVGCPLDINTNGTVAFRGLLAGGPSTYSESASDAGELMDTADRTFGNGPITRISGQLSNDHDVDMFRIRVTDPGTFSATTVPDAGSGFAGATWDTVLTIIASPENGTVGKTQCDNVSAGVVQSTVTGATLVADREYYVCISTPKSRPFSTIRNYSTNTYPMADIWAADPSGLAVGGGLVYWPDPSEDSIGRSTTAGAVQSPLSAPTVAYQIAVDAVGGKVYWIDRADSGARLRRSNLDGTDAQDLITATAFGSVAAYGGTGLALDLINGKVYWARSVQGEINRCNLDGSNPERVIQDYPPTDALYPPAGPSLPLGNFAPTSLAVDAAGGKVYFVNTFLNRIQRANLNGTTRQSLAVGAGTGATALALDVSAGKVYWTATAANMIRRSNLDGTSIEDVVSTAAPVAIALDTAGGFVYWTNTLDRVVRRATLAGAGITDVVTIAPETGERTQNGPGAGNTFTSWTHYGTAGSTALPYQIKLTGATFRHELSMIAKGTQKVVAVGDVIPGTAPNSVTVVGSPVSPIRLSDRGDVLWGGVFYQPTIYNNYLFGGLFWNGERLGVSMEAPTGLVGYGVVNEFSLTAESMDMSDNGEYALVAANMSTAPFVQPDNALLFHFTLPSACVGDFNQSGLVTVQDIFDFLTAYFSNSPSADVNHSGAVTVQDIFDFLAAYFTGCP